MTTSPHVNRFASLALGLVVLFSSGSTFAQTGGISGSVTSAVGENITDGSVFLVNSANTTTIVQQTGISGGSYQFTGVPDGSYYLQTFNARTLTTNYSDEIFDNVACPLATCSYQAGTTVTIAGGNAVLGINFVLDEGAKISGRVTDGTSPLPGITSTFLYDAAGNLSASGGATQSGEYQFFGLSAGTYYIVVSNDQGYQTTIYNGIPCPGRSCNVTTGTPITLTTAQNANTINFTLARGATLSGKVTDSSTKSPIKGAGIFVYDAQKKLVGTAESNATGDYSVGEGFASGDYFALIVASGYVTELHGNLACDECDVTEGTRIPLTAGSNTSLDVDLFPNAATNFPDLRGKFAGVPTTPKATRPTFVVENRGGLGATSFKVKIYRSSKKSVNGRLKLVKTGSVPRLAAGGKRSIPFSLSADKARPFLVAVIDEGNFVPEGNENNNTVTKKP